MSSQVMLNDRYSVRVYCKDNEQVSINTTWFKVTSVAGTITDDELAAFWADAHEAGYKAAIFNGAVYQGVEVQLYRWIGDLRSVRQPVLNGAFAGPGTGGADQIPRQCCGLLSFKGHLAGPAFRGRNYIPFPTNFETTSEGEPTAAYLILLGVILSALTQFISPGTLIIGATGSATCTWQIRHRGQPNPLDVSDVTAGIVKTAFATQRRRGTLGKANKSPLG